MVGHLRLTSTQIASFSPISISIASSLAFPLILTASSTAGPIAFLIPIFDPFASPIALLAFPTALLASPIDLLANHLIYTRVSNCFTCAS